MPHSHEVVVPGALNKIIVRPDSVASNTIIPRKATPPPPPPQPHRAVIVGEEVRGLMNVLTSQYVFYTEKQIR